MKRLILSATFLAFAGFTTVQASNVKEINKIEVSVQDSVVRTPIKVAELPEAVRTALQTEPYKAWTATGAFHVKDAKAGKEWYQIDVRKEQETGSIKFDKDGKPMQ